MYTAQPLTLKSMYGHAILLSHQTVMKFIFIQIQTIHLSAASQA